MKINIMTLMLMWMTATSTLSAQTDRTLTADEVAGQGKDLTAQWKDSVRTAYDEFYKNRILTDDPYFMILHWSILGEKPADGYALYISLHGGGGAPSKINDMAWMGHQGLYRPYNAVYLCPRGITDTWDMHFRPEDDAFYKQIVMMMVAFCDVNPDKVYIMGYSAGGDGVWRMAPRMADHWAAASMMAGHPGEVSLVNLRNTPFMIWCGELDAAYDRNIRCRERIAEMDSLQHADPEGYIHEGHILKGKGHDMNREDTVAVSWMAKYRRDPYPKRIVWRQEEVTRPHFYWLTVPAGELAPGKEVRADIKDNTIALTRCDYSQLTLSLNDTMLNLDEPVTVTFQGKTLFRGKVERRLSTMRSTLYERNDPSYMFPAQVTVKVN
jgi:predicted peptidase